MSHESLFHSEAGLWKAVECWGTAADLLLGDGDWVEVDPRGLTEKGMCSSLAPPCSLLPGPVLLFPFEEVSPCHQWCKKSDLKWTCDISEMGAQISLSFFVVGIKYFVSVMRKMTTTRPQIAARPFPPHCPQRKWQHVDLLGAQNKPLV